MLPVGTLPSTQPAANIDTGAGVVGKTFLCRFQPGFVYL